MEARAVGESSSILQQRLREEAEEGRRAFGFHGVGQGFGRGGALGEVEHRALVSDEDGGDGAERESPRAHGSADGRGVALGPDAHVEDEEDEREENRSVDESVPMRELGDVRVDGARRARAARGARSGVDDEVENSRHGLHDEGGQDGLDAEHLQVQDVKPKPSLDEHVEVAGCWRPTTTVPSVHVPNRPHEATESVGYPPRDTRGRSPERRFFAHWPTSTARRSPRPRTRRQCAESCPRTVWRTAMFLAVPRAARPREGVLSRGRCVLSVVPPRKADAEKGNQISSYRNSSRHKAADTRYAHAAFFSMRSSQRRIGTKSISCVSSARIFSSAGFYAGYVSDEDQAFCSPQSVRIRGYFHCSTNREQEKSNASGEVMMLSW